MVELTSEKSSLSSMVMSCRLMGLVDPVPSQHMSGSWGSTCDSAGLPHPRDDIPLVWPGFQPATNKVETSGC
jgi:hypothetical protein